MIVIGVDVHKQSLTAAAVDELGRRLLSGAGRSRVKWWCGRWRLVRSGCGRSRTADTSRVGWSRRCSRRVSGWCGCRHG